MLPPDCRPTTARTGRRWTRRCPHAPWPTGEIAPPHRGTTGRSPAPSPTVSASLPAFSAPPGAQHVPPPDSGIGPSPHTQIDPCDGPCGTPPSSAICRAHSPQPFGPYPTGQPHSSLKLSSLTVVVCCVDSGVSLPFGNNSHLSNLARRALPVACPSRGPRNKLASSAPSLRRPRAYVNVAYSCDYDRWRPTI